VEGDEPSGVLVLLSLQGQEAQHIGYSAGKEAGVDHGFQGFAEGDSPQMVGGCGFPSMCDYQGDQEKDYYALEEKYFYHIFHQGGKNTLLSTIRVSLPQKLIFKY